MFESAIQQGEQRASSLIARAQRIADSPSDEDGYALFRLRGHIRDVHDRLTAAYEARDKARVEAIWIELRTTLWPELDAVLTVAGQRMNQLDAER